MRRLFLVDTPGFDDTFGDDRRVMKGIADWFANPWVHSAQGTFTNTYRVSGKIDI